MKSPETMIHVDEAYINYGRPDSIETAVPLALEDERVFVTRSFSKAHGMAGLRVGYGLGQEQTLAKIRGAWGMGDVNMLGAIAAITAFEDTEHIDWEVKENAEIRDGVIAGFRDMGFDVPDSHTNHIFVDIGRPAPGVPRGVPRAQGAGGPGLPAVAHHALPNLDRQPGGDGGRDEGVQGGPGVGGNDGAATPVPRRTAATLPF